MSDNTKIEQGAAPKITITGANQFSDYQTLIRESMESGDTLAFGESVAELSEDAQLLMAERLGGDFETMLAELDSTPTTGD